jgi:hypothetical protein
VPVSLSAGYRHHTRGNLKPLFAVGVGRGGEGVGVGVGFYICFGFHRSTIRRRAFGLAVDRRFSDLRRRNGSPTDWDADLRGVDVGLLRLGIASPFRGPGPVTALLTSCPYPVVCSRVGVGGYDLTNVGPSVLPPEVLRYEPRDVRPYGQDLGADSDLILLVRLAPARFENESGCWQGLKGPGTVAGQRESW